MARRGLESEKLCASRLARSGFRSVGCARAAVAEKVGEYRGRGGGEADRVRRGGRGGGGRGGRRRRGGDRRRGGGRRDARERFVFALFFVFRDDPNPSVVVHDGARLCFIFVGSIHIMMSEPDPWVRDLIPGSGIQSPAPHFRFGIDNQFESSQILLDHHDDHPKAERNLVFRSALDHRRRRDPKSRRILSLQFDRERSSRFCGANRSSSATVPGPVRASKWDSTPL